MKIAYLAPELPALSATFVYNEILELEAQGVEVRCYSVHKPAALATDERLAAIRSDTLYLYAESKIKVLASNIAECFAHPQRYLQTLKWLLSDIRELGLTSRTGLGQCMRFIYAVHLGRILRKQAIQHLHVHFAHVPTDIGMYACNMVKIGYSVTAHANDLFERGWLLPQKVSRSAFFGSISEFNLRYLGNLGAPKAKLAITRCGVDDRLFPPVAANKTCRGTIGSIGRLVEKKGFDTLIAAIALLRDRGVNIQLLLAGSGPLESALKQQVTQAGLSDHIDFLGALPHFEVPGFLARLDAFVLPCKKDAQGDMDGIPVVLMEAMLSGVPVISSRISGIPELVVDNVTGLLVEPDDNVGLADAMAKILAEDALRQRLVASAVDHVATEFSLRANVSRLKHKITQVIAED